jgi:hypothetical protein
MLFGKKILLPIIYFVLKSGYLMTSAVGQSYIRNSDQVRDDYET